MLLKYSLGKVPFEQDTNLFDSNSFTHDTVRESGLHVKKINKGKKEENSKNKIRRRRRRKTYIIISPNG